MTLVEHLEELRTRLIVCGIALVAGVALGFVFAKTVTLLLIRPFQGIELKRDEKMLQLRVDERGGLSCIGPVFSRDGETTSTLFTDVSPYRIAFYLPSTPTSSPPDFILGNTVKKPVFLNPLDPATLYFKTAAILGVVIIIPLLLWQLWAFITPGLTRREKRTLVPLLALAAVLFPTGALFAYYMFGVILNFLLNFQIVAMEPQLEVMRYFGLEMDIMIGFGLVFEFPLAIMFLVFLGILQPSQLRKYRGHVIIGLAVAAMAISPGPDIFSMLLILVPMVILYEISIWLSVPLAKKRMAEAET
jgi:sec-independent protein translocase protein TatC